MADVRISGHLAKSQPGGERQFVIIRFREGLENLIGTDYVQLDIRGDRLYFLPAQTKVKGSLRLNSIVNVWKKASVVKQFEGEYSLAYDTTDKAYYVDKTTRSDLTRVYGNHNVPHFNYKAHINPSYEEEREGIIYSSSL